MPDLDDRTWQDLVAEARALIPKYAPQWTDTGPSDLGMTLVELFAWLVEGLIYKLNRVPDKQYLAFLRLLGITRDPATPARTLLTFTPRPDAGAVRVPPGKQAATRTTELERPVVFETDTEVVLTAQPVTAVVLGRTEGATPRYTDVTASVTRRAGSEAPAGVELPITDGSVHLCVGLDAPPGHAFDLHVELTTPLPAGARPRVRWTRSDGRVPPDAWPDLDAVADRTGGLRRSGPALLDLPAGWAAQSVSSWPGAPTGASTAKRYWIAVRITSDPAVGRSAEPAVLGLALVATATVAATAALSTRVPERLGTSDGTPRQVFELSRAALFEQPGTDRPYGHLEVTVTTALGQQRWEQADELAPGPGQQYVVDPVTGEVRFGDFDPDAPAGPAGAGAVPPAGAVITATRYRYVDAGVVGNVPAGVVDVLHLPPADVVAVVNPVPGTGGSDEEDLEQAKRRAPALLRNRNRAVTVDDYEFLAREATTDVAQVRCLPPRAHETFDGSPGQPWTYGGLLRSPGRVNLIVVPRAPLDEPAPRPSVTLVQEVLAELDERRDLVADLHVTGPRYLPVTVYVQALVWQRAVDEGRIPNADAVYDGIVDRVRRFLHPVVGGKAGSGWAVGEWVHASDVFAQASPPPELGYLRNLELGADVPDYHPAGTPYRRDERPPPMDESLPMVNPRPVLLVAEYELIRFARVVMDRPDPV